jgi:hypothetical protein
MPRLLTATQAAEYLGISRKRFQRFAPRLPHLVPGLRTRYYRQSDLDRLELFLGAPPQAVEARSQGKMPVNQQDFWKEEK